MLPEAQEKTSQGIQNILGVVALLGIGLMFNEARLNRTSIEKIQMDLARLTERVANLPPDTTRMKIQSNTTAIARLTESVLRIDTRIERMVKNGSESLDKSR